MKIKTYDKGKKKKLTTNFNLSEIHCHGSGCCSKTKIDLDLVDLAQKIRNMLGTPLHISSGYRCDTHNKDVGGANGSGHCKGTALDIVSSDFSSKQLSISAEILGVPRIGKYDDKPNMIHIGTGDKCHWINTGNYLPASHSFIPVPYKKPKNKVSEKSEAKYIAYVQACLFARGFKGKNGKTLSIDGDWGKNTEYAVNQFRISKGWKPANYLKSKGIKALTK